MRGALLYMSPEECGGYTLWSTFFTSGFGRCITYETKDLLQGKKFITETFLEEKKDRQADVSFLPEMECERDRSASVCVCLSVQIPEIA